jgi:hypothetical protein
MAVDSNFTALMKTLYPKGNVPELDYVKRPLWDMLKKTTNSGGNNYSISVLNTFGTARSHDASIAFTNVTGSLSSTAFTVTYASDHANIYLARKDWMAAKTGGSMGSYGDILKREVNAKRNLLLNNCARQLYSKGLGVAGEAASVSGTSIVLKNTRDHRNFRVGDVIKMDTTPGTGTVHAGSTVISAIDRSTGTLTCGTTYVTGAIASAAANDYIFLDGDFGNGFYGMTGWLSGATSSESFYGVDRTSADHLQGVNFNLSGDRIEGLIDAVDTLYDIGESVPDAIFVNGVEYAQLAKELQPSTFQYAGGKGALSFDALTLASPSAGPIKIILDPFCPEDIGLALKLDTWEMRSIGPVPHLHEEDYYISAASADYFSVRMSAYPSVCCTQPNRNMVINFS